jgi:mRNA-degrading endonuclease RelE of RelBE toxin-antitoxin system
MPSIPKFWEHNKSSAMRKVHSTKGLLKKLESSHTSSLKEFLKAQEEDRDIHNKEEEKAGNNQYRGLKSIN